MHIAIQLAEKMITEKVDVKHIIHMLEEELSIVISVKSALKIVERLDCACFDFRMDWN